MSSDRAASDAFLRLLGYTQKYLDRVHKGADKYQATLAARGPQPPYEPASSDSEYDDSHLAPLSPPPSPRREGPDQSEGVWCHRRLADLARGIEPRDSYETWRSHTITKHAQKALLAIPTPSPKPRVRRRSRRAVTIVSERITRSKATLASVFYELGHGSNTGQLLPLASSISPPDYASSRRAAKSSRQQRPRFKDRIRKW